MELRHLRYFVAVAEELHFGRAAARLRIAQPPLSRQIRDLEGELGCELLHRTPRKVELTPAGTVFLAEARRLLERVEAAIEAARRASRGQYGKLAVGFVPSVSYTELPEVLRGFRERFPEVEVRIKILGPSEQVRALLDGDLDLGFLRGPVGHPKLEMEQVRVEPLLAALPSHHPLATRPELALSALASEPFVFVPRERAPEYYDQLIALCRGAGFSPRVVQEAAQLELLSLVAAGFGVSLLPASFRHLRRFGVAFRPLRGRPKSIVVAAWRRDNDSPSLREFLKVLRRTMRTRKRARARTRRQ